MKKMSLEEWDNMWVAGEVELFDQKYTMFNRPDWDFDIRGEMEDWSFVGEPKDKIGWRQEDFALRNANAAVTGPLSLFNFSKPNPMKATQAILKILFELNPKAGPKPPAGKIDISDPQRITSMVKKVATFFGADLVGVCKLDRRWVYSHSYECDSFNAGNTEESTGESRPQLIPDQFQYAIVMAFEMDYELYRYTPAVFCGAPSGLAYAQMAFTNAMVAEFIRGLGFFVLNGTTNDIALTVPLAMQAGLGELGRLGILITREYGPRVRLSKIITDLPLVPDSPIEFGVTDFCNACEKCSDHCPSKSIPEGDRTEEQRNVSNIKGARKWHINAETCRKFWAQRGSGCEVCISVCPYNKVNTWPHKVVRWFTDNVRPLDKFYVWMDDLFRYGRPKSANGFWENWKP